MKTSVQLVDSVCLIDFPALTQAGIDCALFDIEGTLTLWGGDTVDTALVDCINTSGIVKRGIITNLNKQWASRAQKVASQINAASCQYPRRFRDRKPSRRMLITAMAELSAQPHTTIMVGDKLLDVLAAKRAGVHTAYWVKKQGSEDQWFDKYLYRYIEPLLKKLIAF